MAIHHLKHRYLIKKQFLEENEFNHFRFFFFLFLFFLACAFLVFAHFRFQQDEFSTFFSEHRNLIVHDLERTSLVSAFSVEGDPWSRLMKEIIRLNRGQLVDNFILVKG